MEHAPTAPTSQTTAATTSQRGRPTKQRHRSRGDLAGRCPASARRRHASHALASPVATDHRGRE
eukprot:scaffold130950_cov29-Tisochrysis_lutea.AAC.3